MQYSVARGRWIVYSEYGKCMRKPLDFTLITNPIGPSNKARHAMRRTIKTVRSRPDGEAQFLTRYLSNKEGVAAEQILLGHGSSHILTVLVQALKPRSILMPSPFPQAYQALLQKQGIEIRPFPLDRAGGFEFDAQKFKADWEDAEAALILNPHNPTGSALPERDVIDLIETSERVGKLLVIDEALGEFRDSASPARRAVEASHVLLLRTFSWYHALVGLRLGYAIGHPALLDKLRSRLDPWPVNSIALAAALASLKDKGYRRRTADFLAAEKAYVLKKLGGLAEPMLHATPWGFLIRMHPTVPNVTPLFFEKGILVEAYFAAQGEEYVAFPLRSRPKNAQFLRVLQRILREQKAV
jgi:threonine-phosphate decarboxylase